MDIQLLEEFFVFARHLNVSSAAKELHISQPTLSKHIKALEREFGKPLVNHEKDIKLTPAGLRLSNYSSDLVALYRELMQVMAQEPDSSKEIKVAYDWNSGCSHVNVAVVRNKFFEACPEYRLTWVQQTLETAYETLNSADIDCAMVYWTPIASDIERGVQYVRLPDYVPNRLFLWVGARNLFAMKPSVSWEDVRMLKIINQKDGTTSSTARQELFERHDVKLRTVAQNEEMISDYFDMHRDEALPLDEQLTTFVSVQTVPNRRILLVDEADAVCGTYLAYLPNRVSPALQTLLDFVHATTA